MTHNLTLGLDIGGTKIALVVADKDGQIHAETTIPTLADNPTATTLDRIAELIRPYLAQYDPIAGIGIGIPGPIDSQQGIALNAVNLRWKNLPVCDELQQRLQTSLPIYIENDVNVGAIGEQLFGVAQGVSSYVYLAIGTGIGGAVMLNNQIMQGVTHSEMEIGHIAIDPIHGRLCNCGLRGCVETFISGNGFVMNAKQHYDHFPETSISADNITTREIIKWAKQGDPLADHVINEAATVLGKVCAWCSGIFNPSHIILAGGISHATYDMMQAQTLSSFKQHTFAPNYDAVQVILSTLSNAALGASALVWYYQRD